jgi:hypothetical protein
VVGEVIVWADDVNKRAFLQAMLSFQRARHLAAAWNLCTNCDGEPWSKQDAVKAGWIDDLVAKKVVRRKDGGFIWFDSFFRERLRKCLTLSYADLASEASARQLIDLKGEFREKSGEERFDKFKNTLTAWRNEQISADGEDRQGQIHLQIAMWYLRLSESTGTARAILEAIDHMMFAVDSKVRTLDVQKSARKGKAGKIQLDTLKESEDRIDAARHLLREHAFHLQTDGHPLASKRRLEYICNFCVDKPRGSGVSLEVIINVITGADTEQTNWSARLELCQWIRETLDKESVWDEARSTSLSR